MVAFLVFVAVLGLLLTACHEADSRRLAVLAIVVTALFATGFAVCGCSGEIAGVSCDDASADAAPTHDARAHHGTPYDSGDVWTGLEPLGNWPCLSCPKPTGHINEAR